MRIVVINVAVKVNRAVRAVVSGNQAWLRARVGEGSPMALVFDFYIEGDPLLVVAAAGSSNCTVDAPSPFHFGAYRGVSAPKIGC